VYIDATGKQACCPKGQLYTDATGKPACCPDGTLPVQGKCCPKAQYYTTATGKPACCPDGSVFLNNECCKCVKRGAGHGICMWGLLSYSSCCLRVSSCSGSAACAKEMLILQVQL
jgi:hypothetical protein